MRRSLVVSLVAVLGLGMAGLAFSACDQGVGDRCQVQSDCEDGLVCNKATNQCQNRADVVDAGVDATLR